MNSVHKTKDPIVYIKNLWGTHLVAPNIYTREH